MDKSCMEGGQLDDRGWMDDGRTDILYGRSVVPNGL